MKRLPITLAQRWIEDFISTTQSEHTVRQYRAPLYKFSDWLRDRSFCRGDEFIIPTAENIEEYLNKLFNDGVPVSMRSLTISAIRSWFGFLGRKGLVKSNPAYAITNPKRPEVLYRPPTEKRVQSDLASINDMNSVWPARDRAIFETIYEVALSSDEVCALKVEDIDWKLPALSVGGMWLPMEEALVNTLRIYITERDADLASYNIDPTATLPLFIRKGDAQRVERRLGTRQLFRIVKRIDPRLNPRKLRDACGIHMLEHGADLRIVAHLFRMGISTADRLRRMASSKPRKQLMKSHPRPTLTRIGDTAIH